MTVLKVLGILLLLLLLLGLLRVGVIVSFGAALRVRLRVGALRLTLYPKSKPGRKGKGKKADNKRKTGDTSSKRTPLQRPTLHELTELADTALGARGVWRRSGVGRRKLRQGERGDVRADAASRGAVPHPGPLAAFAHRL